MWILLCCFHRIYDCRKKFVGLYLFSPIGYQKNDEIIYTFLRKYMAKENVSTGFRQ